MTMQDARGLPREDARGLKAGLWAAGIASILLGTLAIVFPFAASVAAELLFGALLAALGVMQIGRAILVGGVGSRAWNLVFGGISLAAGVVLLLFPLQGVFTLTVVFSVFFVLGGIATLTGAWAASPGRRRARGLREVRGWGWSALSGALSILLGVLLFLGLPATAAWALGLLFGIDLLFLGASEIALAVALSSSDEG